MKKLIIITTIFLLIFGVISVTLTTTAAAAGDESATKTLTVKLGDLTFVNDGPFDKGDRIYAEYDLIDPEDEGYTIIGHYIYDAIRRTPGWYASEHFNLDGLGTIETVGEGPPWGGAIIGGTGAFVGASGEWHSESKDGFYLTFIFEIPVKLVPIE